MVKRSSDDQQCSAPSIGGVYGVLPEQIIICGAVIVTPSLVTTVLAS